MLIITPDHEENEAEALIENVKGIIENGANLIHTDVWGKRRLAYPIRKRTEGYYVVYVFESAPEFIAQVNQALRVIEAILRHMIVLYEDDIQKLIETTSETTEIDTPSDDTVENTTKSVEDSKESPEDITPQKEEISDSDEDAAEQVEDAPNSDEETPESA